MLLACLAPACQASPAASSETDASGSGGAASGDTLEPSGGPSGGTTSKPGTGTDDTGLEPTTGEDTSGEAPEPPDLQCPGDRSGQCDADPQAKLEAGAAVRSIVPDCYESWVDLDENFAFKHGNDELLDCGCDRLCPGDPGYIGPDDGEGDGELQPAWMAGFGNGRPATGVRGEGVGLVGEGDGLWARAIVLRQGNTTVAIVAMDLVGWFNGDVLAARELLAEQGLDVDHLIVHSTHTHEGPDSMGMWGADTFTPSVVIIPPTAPLM